MAKSIITPEEAAAKRTRIKAYQAEHYLKNREERKAKSRAHYAANKEKINAQKRIYGPKWAAANPDKVKAKMTKWRDANREVARDATKRWRAQYPERALAAVNRWSSNNVERVRATKATRRAREISAEGTFNASDVQTLFKRQNGKCVYCDLSIRSYFNVDHIIPLARGGTNWPDNIQLTCPPCNQRKHAKNPEDFVQEVSARQHTTRGQ